MLAESGEDEDAIPYSSTKMYAAHDFISKKVCQNSAFISKKVRAL